MQYGRFNVVTDGAWGSCGKGAITTALAARYLPHVISTTNMANAGHTAVNTNGEKFIAKALPSATVLHKWLQDYDPQIVVGAGAAFTIDQLLHEYEECGQPTLSIHPRAGVITEDHKNIESDATKHVASTMQGCGAFLADKIMRKRDLKLARDYAELNPFVFDNLTMHLLKLLENNKTVLHEGAQGFSLDISHGSHYPECTSRGTTATQNFADMGIPVQYAGDIYLVIRPYPIRVGNVVEDGKTVGYSGDCYPDHQETTWAEVAAAAGAPPEVMAGELTTVTKRLRRVFTFSETQFREAAVINGATKIALNFANYIDWSCFGSNSRASLSPKILDFIGKIEQIAGIPVVIVGTGPQLDHMIFLE